MLIKHKVQGFMNVVHETAEALWFPDLVVPKNYNVLAVIENESGKILHAGMNKVTDSGDSYYAEKGAGEAASNAFTQISMSSASFVDPNDKTNNADDLTITVTAGTTVKTATAGYPKTSDADADNTGSGADVISWLFEYAKTDFNDTAINAGAIHVVGAVFGGASGDPILNSFHFPAAFGKSADDTLKVFVNHTMNGV